MVGPESKARREHILQRYDHYTAYPLFLLSLMFLVGLIMVVDAAGEAEYVATGQTLMTVSWFAFLVDYVVRLVLTTHRLKFISENILQGIAVLVPPLRILLLGKVVKTMTSGAKRKFRGRVRVYALYLTTLTLVIAAVLVTMFERNAPGSNIHSLGDAIWWTTETVSTVGYGDFYPVTLPGRAVAVVLFINGIALLSAVTATISAKVLDYDDSTGKDTGVTLGDIHQRLADIEVALGNVVTPVHSGAEETRHESDTVTPASSPSSS